MTYFDNERPASAASIRNRPMHSSSRCSESRGISSSFLTSIRASTLEMNEEGNLSEQVVLHITTFSFYRLQFLGQSAALCIPPQSPRLALVKLRRHFFHIPLRQSGHRRWNRCLLRRHRGCFSRSPAGTALPHARIACSDCVRSGRLLGSPQLLLYKFRRLVEHPVGKGAPAFCAATRVLLEELVRRFVAK